jgi:signal transduction histidine kinase
MKRTIRVRFFIWLTIQTSLVFLSIGLALSAYDFHEYLKNPSMKGGELEEIVVVGVVMLILFPLNLAGAWLISRRLLRPWKSLTEQAEDIAAGRLTNRILVVNPSDEIGRLAATLNQTFDRYENLLDRMQRFSYDASHQLRNPLAALRTTSEVCLKQPRTAEEYCQAIEGILENAVRLSRTVDQLLLLARAAGGTLDEYRQRVCLQDLAREMEQEGQAIGEMRELSVELAAPETPLIIQGVPDLLREALANLLDNALKFSPDGGRIKIGLSEPVPETVRITVCDSGPGLSPSQKATVFRPFVRNGDSGKESVGLGLALVADICRAHHGHFGVDDNAGGGCCFWLELPTLKDPSRGR